MVDPEKPEHQDDAGGEPASSRPPPVTPRQGRRGGGAPRGPRSAYSRFVKGKISVGEVLGSTFSFFFRNLLLYLGIAVLVFSPSILLKVGWFGEIHKYIFWILDFILGQIMTAAIIYGVFRQMKNKKAGIGSCLSAGLGRLLPLIGVVFLTSALSFSPLIPGAVMVLSGSLLSDSPQLVLVMLGSVLLAVGYVFFIMIYIALFAATPAVVVERTGVREAIRRSLFLTRGNRWRIFGIYFVISCIGFVVGMIWTMATMGAAMATGLIAPTMAFVLGTIVLSTVFSVLNAVAVGSVFFNLKVKVEGIGEEDLAAIFD